MSESVTEYLKSGNYNFIGEQNPQIKRIKNIINNTKPNPEKLFVAEGLWAFKKLTEFKTEVIFTAVCPDFIRTEEAFSALKAVGGAAAERYAVSGKTFLKLSERDKPDGLLAVAKLPKFNIADFKPAKKSAALVLDGIEIPGNVGTMLRMADGAGLAAVFVCNKRARLSHPKLIKGSMGAVLSVPLYEFGSFEECRDYLLNAGFKIYLADTRAERFYFEERFSDKTAIVMGSERYGITRGWYDKEHTMIAIPMLGSCDSLNVGVAATVLSYEVSAQHRFKKNTPR